VEEGTDSLLLPSADRAGDSWSGSSKEYLPRTPDGGVEASGQSYLDLDPETHDPLDLDRHNHHHHSLSQKQTWSQI